MVIGRVALPLARKFIVPAAKTYWKRITCSSSTRINRHSNQEEKRPKQALKKHSKKTQSKKQVGAGRSKIPYEQKNGREQQQQQQQEKEKQKLSFHKKRNPTEKSVQLFSPKYEMISNFIAN